jgi:hypothetical protein
MPRNTTETPGFAANAVVMLFNSLAEPQVLASFVFSAREWSVTLLFAMPSLAVTSPAVVLV